MVVVVRRGDPGVIEEIVPKSAASAESFGGSLGTGLFAEEAALVARATEKRRQEFTTGRECARAALTVLGVAAVPILRGYRGAPQWPAGIVGSITHCAGYCAAAVARAQDLLTVGLDAEPNAPLPGGVLELVSLPAERARLRELAAASPGIAWDRLLFCAKEAVYKAWFPLTGQWLGFADADITIDQNERTFSAALQVPGPTVNGAPLAGFTGGWLASEDLIVAAIAVTALPGPAAAPGALRLAPGVHHPAPFSDGGCARENAVIGRTHALGAGVAEIVIDPTVPPAARRELEQASLSALVGFSDPLPGQEVPAEREDAGRARLARPYGVRVAVGFLVSVMATLLGVGLSSASPFGGDLAYLAGLIIFLCLAVGGLTVMEKDRRTTAEATGRPWARRGAAVSYRRRYVVPELDLHGESLARWQRASQAARTIQASEAVRLGLINSVEVAAVLPYHRWDVAERLALLSGPERRQAAILRELDSGDPDVQVVLGPQRKAQELALADIDRRIGRLEEFADLAAKADAARKRRAALEDLARLNGDYQELLVRLGDADDALTPAGRPAGELRAMAAEADDAVRRANDAGRALLIPRADRDEPASGEPR